MDKYIERIKNQDVPVIKFEKLNNISYIKHGFSTRLGGVSKGIYSSMNLSFNRGDDYSCIRKNYDIIAQTLDLNIEDMVLSAQTHTTNVLKVGRRDCGKGILFEKGFDNIDGMITNEPNVVLVTSYADCVPLYFVDTKNKAIGLSHSGWRGTVNKMGKVTIERMREEFNTKPEDLICVIGPSICKNCYEVSYDVINKFEKSFDEKFHKKIFTEKANGKYMLNLWKANEIILLQAGVRIQNIENRQICTCCNKDILFSHRGSNGKRGNLCAFLSISGQDSIRLS